MAVLQRLEGECCRTAAGSVLETLGDRGWLLAYLRAGLSVCQGPSALIHPCAPPAGLMQPSQESCSSQAVGSEADSPPRGFLGRFDQQRAQGDVEVVLAGVVEGVPDARRTDQAAVLPGSLPLLAERQAVPRGRPLAAVAPLHGAPDWYFHIRRSLFSLKLVVKHQQSCYKWRAAGL